MGQNCTRNGRSRDRKEVQLLRLKKCISSGWPARSERVAHDRMTPPNNIIAQSLTAADVDDYSGLARRPLNHSPRRVALGRHCNWPAATSKINSPLQLQEAKAEFWFALDSAARDASWAFLESANLSSIRNFVFISSGECSLEPHESHLLIRPLASNKWRFVFAWLAVSARAGRLQTVAELTRCGGSKTVRELGA